MLCQYCHAPMEPRREWQVYCSSLCRQKTRIAKRPSRALPIKTAACKHCQTPFQTTREQQKFCSSRCADVQFVSDNRAKINERAKEKMRQRRAEGDPRIAALSAAYRAKPESRAEAAAKSRKWHSENKEHANSHRKNRLKARLETHPWHTAMLGAKLRAAHKKIPFGLTDEWAAARWTGRCELTNIPFVKGTKYQKLFAASCDKIIPSLGYIPDNSRFVLNCVNMFKSNGPDTMLYEVAEALLKNKT